MPEGGLLQGLWPELDDGWPLVSLCCHLWLSGFLAVWPFGCWVDGFGRFCKGVSVLGKARSDTRVAWTMRLLVRG